MINPGRPTQNKVLGTNSTPEAEYTLHLTTAPTAKYTANPTKKTIKKIDPGLMPPLLPPPPPPGGAALAQAHLVLILNS